MYWWQYIPDPRLTNIPFWVKLLPWFWLRNEDDPVPPPWYEQKRHFSDRWMRWQLRNVFHNVGYYILGKADKPSWRYGIYPALDWNPNGGLNFAVSFLYGCIPAPFISYRGKRVEWYLGWQPHSDFGAALRRANS